jgi:hypothetical protein
MGRMSFRNAYEFDPNGAQRAGGLLGMLQAMMQQGQVGAGADFTPQNPGSQTPTVPQISDYGETPPTRITVRPIDAYSLHDPESDGGLLGRLLSLQAEQSRYQPAPVNSGQTPSAPPDPNFRQLSRAPIAVGPQGGIGNPSDDQSSRPYSPFGDSTSLDQLRRKIYSTGSGQPVLSDVSPDPVRPGSQYTQALGLCAAGPLGCAVGGGITAGQAILGGAAALLGGATILNNKNKPLAPGNKPAAPAGVDAQHSMQAAGGGLFGTYGAKPISPWIATAPTGSTYPPGLQGGGTLGPPIGPMPLPPIPRPGFLDWWRPAWKALQLDGSNYPGGGGGGGGKDYRRCMEAAEQSTLQWENFCRSLAPGSRKSRCWGQSSRPEEDKKVWCRNELGPPR